MTAPDERAADARKEVVIVTGSSGFIGSAIVERLAERYVVVGLDRDPPRQPQPAEHIGIDLTSDESVREALGRVRAAHGARIASVIHLAAYFDLSGEPNPLYEAVTVRGTARLLRELKSSQVEQFVFSSTMLVHRAGKPGERIDEDRPLDPKLPYRASKVETEALIRDRHGDIPVVLLRPAGVYDDRCHNAFLARQIARIYERSPKGHVYPGDLRTGQSFLHLDDLVEAVALLVERRANLPTELPLLLGEPDVMSFGELQQAIGRLIHGEEWQTWEIPAALAKAGAWIENDVLGEDSFIRPWMVDIAGDHYALDITRARTALGWEPKHSLRETLPKMIAALKDDPAGWYRANKLNAAKVAARSAEAEREPPSREEAVEHERVIHRHMDEMEQMHRRTLWAHFATIALGLWLATSPFVLDAFGADTFRDAVLRITEERGLWSPALRSALLGWSDLLSGLLIAAFGALSLSRRHAWAQWANTAVGIWLLFAPLVFWSQSAAAYLNDTLVGSLVIAFAILVPMMPGMSMAGMMDPSDTLPGWTYCPSTYLQRLPIIALGLVGFLISRTLTAYQLGHIDGVWDPFFSGEGALNGTEFIVTSDVSKAWPIPDAGLGAVSYMFEILMGIMGSRKRWRTMPWMVTMFGIVVVPLGVVSITFIVIQPIVIGTWCTLCLAAALAMLVMIPYSLDELVAMGQFLVQGHREGQPFWRIFFQGGAIAGSGSDDKPDFGAPLPEMAASAARGVTVPWTLLASTVLGVWLMFTRAIFGTAPPMADNDHLVGALVVTVAVIAMAEVARPLRFVNVLFGAWLIVAPWLLGGETTVASWASVIVGIALIGLSLPRGKRSDEHYGGWDRYVV